MATLSRFALPTLIAGLAYAAAPLAADTLTGSEWAPVEFSGENVDASGDVFVRFEQDGVFVGNGGCNNFRGRFVTNGDAILFGPAAATMMLCPDDVSAVETQFFQSIAKARVFMRNGSVLGLSDSDGNPVMSLAQRDTD